MKRTQANVPRLLLLLLVWCSLAVASPQSSRETPLPNLEKASLSQLEERIEAIDSQLERLAHYNLRSGVGSIGFRSEGYPTPDQREWFQVDLETPTPIDQIILVPSIWRDTKAGYNADGFPAEFKVIAGLDSNTEGTVIASFSESDQVLPRIAPLVIPCQTTASWIRVETSKLPRRLFDGMYNLELAEIMIFNGQENVALHRQVTTSSGLSFAHSARQKSFLVDGFVPYLMDAGRGQQSIAFVSNAPTDEQPSIHIDLKESYALNRLHLHSIDSSDTFPQANPANFGLPLHLLVEAANQPDFSDASPLVEYRQQSIYDVGPIIMRTFPETYCRYIRLRVLKPYVTERTAQGTLLALMGFAEIELFAGGRNVAAHKKAEGHLLKNPKRSYASLTDGKNLYGKILPIRQWMNELAQRHELENEHPRITAELTRRYARQKQQLRILLGLSALLAVGIGFVILIERMRRIRQIARLKERFAADLHDELGANLHTIGLLSDLSKEMIHSPEKLANLLDRIRNFTQRSGTAARYCTNMLEAEGICENLVDEMKRSSKRLLADLDYEIEFSGEARLQTLKPRVRIDIFLFFKECLINILRHSGATQVAIRLDAHPDKIHLTITDNGQGIASGKDAVPPSSKRRARLLRARVSAEQCEQGGTRIRLTVKPNKFRLL